MNLKRITFLIFLFVCTSSFAGDIVYLQKSPTPKSEREAILILVGFGSKLHNERKIAKHFRDQGYDIYQPKYVYRKSIQQGELKLQAFTNKHDLKAYKKLHVVCYIIGGWTFNNWVNSSGLTNIQSIIYDRSPLQERAPQVLMQDSKIITKLYIGQIIQEFAETPYPPLVDSQANIGIMIETQPTKLIRKHRKSAAAMGPISWKVSDLNQPFSDYCYIPVDHDELYTNVKLVSPLIFEFIKTGNFSDSCNRTAPSIDPLIELTK